MLKPPPRRVHHVPPQRRRRQLSPQRRRRHLWCRRRQCALLDASDLQQCATRHYISRCMRCRGHSCDRFSAFADVAPLFTQKARLPNVLTPRVALTTIRNDVEDEVARRKKAARRAGCRTAGFPGKRRAAARQPLRGTATEPVCRSGLLRDSATSRSPEEVPRRRARCRVCKRAVHQTRSPVGSFACVQAADAFAQRSARVGSRDDAHAAYRTVEGSV